MRLFIASDIHGSEYYCRKMIDAFLTEKADKMLLLGDVLYHGPRNELPKDYNPKSVIAMLNNIKDKILCVRGNCDSEVDQMVLEFPVMSDYIMLVHGDITLFATHGHIYNKDNLPPFSKGMIVLNGHTHIPELTVNEDYILINPGSVSIPKENSVNGYIMFDENEFWWKDFNNNILKNFKF